VRTPLLKIGVCAVRQEYSPCFLERAARLVEGRGRADGALARMAAWVEAASPAPWIFLERNADPLGDRAGVDIAIVDVPAFVLGFEVSAAGEGGHGP
jgi:hypothetical protein